MKICSVIFLMASLLFSNLLAQPKCHIRHYDLRDGLPQRTIMNIIQDHKGFIWLATWDGLCKFDGQNFKTFKTSQADSIFMSNNRIDRIYEDALGYIWLHTYNRQAFRFNPKTEQYVGTFQLNGKLFDTSRIVPMPSGKVWLLSNNMGAICVSDSTNQIETFSMQSNHLQTNTVLDVYEDRDSNAWLLTDNGLMKFDPSGSKNKQCNLFYASKGGSMPTISFQSVIEIDNELWFGADNGRVFCYDKSTHRFKIFETGTKSNIISIKKVYDNLLILLTSNDGFVICDKSRSNIRQFNTTTLKDLPTNEMLSCFVDSEYNIWLEMNCIGVGKFNILKNKIKHYQPMVTLDENKVFSPPFFILEDNTGRIWVHPHECFSYYDKASDRLLPFYNAPLSPNWKFSNMLHDVFLDKQGHIWLSTRTGGIEKIVFDNDFFKLNNFQANKSLGDSEVRAIFEDNENNIWIGSKDERIAIYSPTKEFQGFLCANGSVSKTGVPLKASVYALYQDKRGKIWVGSKGNGLFALDPIKGVKTSYKVKHYIKDDADEYAINSNVIYSIHEDKYGRLWFGSYGGGLNLYDAQYDRFINYNNLLKNFPFDIGKQTRNVKSHNNKLYIGTTFGLIVMPLDLKNSNITSYKIYSKSLNTENGLKASDIYEIYITQNNDVYIATFGGGMAKVSEFDAEGYPSKFTTYDTTNGLNSDIVLSIIEDNNNLLWLNSEGNLSRFDPQNQTFEFFDNVSRVLKNQYFSEATPLLSKDGEIIYGYIYGTLSFVPDKNYRHEFVPYLSFTKFKISNNELPLKYKLDDINQIDLSYKESIFSIEYTALDFANPQGISYAYMLEGFDDNWIFSQKQRVANYTNIPPGEYVFKVKSTNSNGTWVDNSRSLHISIKPAVWQTKWAYLIYVTLSLMIIYFVLRSVFVFYRMKDKVLLEQEETEMKTRFFTDISHEIRTPLTMIVAPLENILAESDTSDKQKKQLQLVLKNANRMLKMVNQILDFTKIQKQKLRIKEVAIGYYIQELCTTSIKTIENQGVNLEVNNLVGDEKIWIDLDSIEKLVFNLISNSIKHTSSGKKIEINVFKKDKMIALQVKDEGTGMTKEIMSKLFTRFASYNTDKSKPSTGIGLSIVKEIVEKHYARILVESDVNRGASFTILFQLGLDHFANDDAVEIIHSKSNLDTQAEPIEDISANWENRKETINNRLTLLIVEDDNDLRNFIKSVLSTSYNVIEAKDGKEALDIAIKNMPDFILSDVMMPELDGIELLQKIRNNVYTSHIPFILLTAKTNCDDNLEGITQGADDYITKPFNVKILTAKIENILKQRKRFADFLTGSGMSQQSFKDANNKGFITDQDQLFIRNLQEEVSNNLDNSNFVIDDLVAKTNLSRRVFFNKVKSLTGLAPIEFVREVRLKQSAQLLKNKDYRIKEIIYMVGFSDVRYFSQCFKKMYGMTPSQYRDQYLK